MSHPRTRPFHLPAALVTAPLTTVLPWRFLTGPTRRTTQLYASSLETRAKRVGVSGLVEPLRVWPGTPSSGFVAPISGAGELHALDLDSGCRGQPGAPTGSPWPSPSPSTSSLFLAWRAAKPPLSRRGNAGPRPRGQPHRVGPGHQGHRARDAKPGAIL